MQFQRFFFFFPFSLELFSRSFPVSAVLWLIPVCFFFLLALSLERRFKMLGIAHGSVAQKRISPFLQAAPLGCR